MQVFYFLKIMPGGGGKKYTYTNTFSHLEKNQVESKDRELLFYILKPLNFVMVPFVLL